MKKIWSFFGGLGLLVACQATVFAQEFTITGSIQDGSGNGIGGQIAILDPVSGDQIAEIFVNGDGSPTASGLIPAGQYVAYAGRRFGTEGFVEERWDGGEPTNLSCPNLSCDVLGGATIDLTSGDVTGIDFVLDPVTGGGRLSGTVTDPLGSPVVGVSLVVFSADGFEVQGVSTDRTGTFTTSRLSNADVYLRVQNDTPRGLAPEIWNGGEPGNTVCFPFSLCLDTANGSPITIAGGDVTGLDFELEVPVGGQVIGSFEDLDFGFALADMNVELLDSNGGFVTNVQSDATGTYTFAGLADGDYKVFISGPTEGYPQYLIGQGSCSLGCDTVTNGVLFMVSGGGVVNVPAEQVAYEGGPRVTGIITRTDTGEPVSSRVGYVGADLFDTSGNFVVGGPTDRSGRYQLLPPGGAGDYVAITTHDQGFHGLINELFDNVACPLGCGPNDPARAVLNIPAIGTVTALADFALDPGRAISGTVTSTVGGAPIEGLTVCAEPEPEPDGQLMQCVDTDAGGNYSIAGLVARADYVVSTFNNGLPFIDEIYDDLRDVPLSAGTLIDVTGGDATGIDFGLEAGGFLSGAILDEFGNPLNDGGAVEIVVLDASGNEVWRGNNGDSTWSSATFVAGDYYGYAFGENFGRTSEVWNDVDCPNLTCDTLAVGTPITITGGEITGIDFTLAPAQEFTITGSIQDGSGNGIGGQIAILHPTTGDQVAELFVDGNGNGTTGPIPAGQYVAYAGRRFGAEGFVEERWDGGEPANLSCPSLSCDVLGGATIDLTSGDVTGIDFVLDPVTGGGRLSGTVTDPLGSPVVGVSLVVFSADGFEIQGVSTDRTGTFTTSLLSNADVYLRVQNDTPRGLAPELWNGGEPGNTVCFPFSLCLDTANGSPITIAGGDVTGLDFELEVPAGGFIDGRLVDADASFPLAEMQVAVFDEFDNFVSDVRSAQGGAYALSGLPDGTYRLQVTQPTEGYQPALFGFGSCPEPCDRSQGTALVISGGNTINNPDLPVQYVGGPRLTGIITRSDTGEPVSSITAGAAADIYDSSGSFLGGFGTDRGGRYQALLPAGDYIVLTVNEQSLVNEVFDNIPCVFGCDPNDPAATAVTVPGTGAVTGQADFVLDPGGTISGALQDELGNPLNDFGQVQIVVLDASGNEVARGNNNGDSSWQSPTLPAGDYFVYAFGEQAGFTTEVWNNVDCPSVNCDVLTVGTAVPITGGDVTGIDFTLAPAQEFTITGSIQDGSGNGIGGQIAILNANTGDQVAEVFVDGNGDGTTGPILAGQYVAYAGRRFGAEGFVEERWDGGEPANLSCPSLSCDVLGGATIDLTSGDVTGIDFVLDPVTGGGRLSGTVTDPLGSPVVGVSLVVFSADGFEVQGVSTDRTGTFTTSLLSNADVYLRVQNDTPRGLAPELWNGGEPGNTVCFPFSLCLDTANGSPITIAGGDVTGLDFELEVPAGGFIDGRLVDADASFPLAEMQVAVFDEFDNFVSDVRSAQGGAYALSGLPDGTYRLQVTQPTEGYQPALFGFGSCPEPCDRSQGTALVISGGNTINNPDLPVQYVGGPRLTGIITRSDTGEPVSSITAGAAADIYDSSGSFLGGFGTDRGGRYQALLPAGDYIVLTVNEQSLVNEVFDNIPCVFGCDPNDPAATAVTVPGTGAVTGQADFVLDPGRTISGTVRAEDDLSMIADANVCIGIGSEAFNGFRECRSTDSQGRFSFGGLLAIPDYVVGAVSFSGQLFIRELFDDAPCCNLTQGTPIDTTLADRDITIDVTRSAAISGMIRQTGNLNPIQGVSVQIFDESCALRGSGQSDAGGNYTVTGFVEGNYFVYARANFAGFVPELYPNLKRLSPCSPNPIGDGTPVLVPALQQVPGIDFELDRGASISGFVSDAGGVLPPFNAQARLHDLAGTLLFNGFNNQPDNSYLLQGLPPGDYNVVLSGAGPTQGLVDEIFDNIPCPRNSCSQGTGVTISVAPGQARTGINAVLEVGSQISGRLTNATDEPLAACIAIYNDVGAYAGSACSDSNGDYTTRNGFPAGDYLVSNQFNINGPQPVDGGFIPTVWPGLACGEPCNFLLGDPIVVDGANPVTGIDLVFQTGSSISGSVTGDGSPVGGVQVRLLNATDGALVRSALSGADGAYAFEGIGAGDYLLRTSNSIGLNDQLYAGISCNPFCDPLSGTVVNLPPDTDRTGIDFPLASTPRIVGTVFDDVGAPVGGVRVEAYNSLGALVASTTSAADGSFEIGNLFSGTFFVRTANTLDLIDALADGLFCPAGCNPSVDGTPIGVGPSGSFPAGGLDLQLGDASALFGRVTNGTNPLASVEVRVYTPAGALAASQSTSDDGTYTIEGLAAGRYHVVTRNGQGFIDEGAAGTACPASCAPTTTSTIELLISQQLELDFVLSQGGRISGRVTDALGGPLPSVEVTIFTDSGVEVSSAISDASGNYSVNALLPADYVARTTSNPHGLRNRLYDDQTCDADCDVLGGTLISLTSGASAIGIDFVLPDGKSISGLITDTLGDPIGGIRVAAFDASEVESASGVTGSGGLFTITGLPDGVFQLRTFNALNFIDQAIGGDECTPTMCALNLATSFDVQAQSQTGADAALRSGQLLTGTATDDSGNPIFSGSAQLYSDQAELLKTAVINEGTFTFSGLAGGTYYAVVTNDLGLVDQAWTGAGQPGLDCPGGSCLSCLTTSSCDAPPAGPAAIVLADPVRGAVGGSDLSFRLPAGERLQGSVADAQGNPQPSVRVYFFNEFGADAGAATTDGLGQFESDSAFGAGVWFAATRKPGQRGAIGFIDELFDDIPCGAVCEPTDGDAFSTPSAPMIDFQLDRRPTERIFGSGFEF